MVNNSRRNSAVPSHCAAACEKSTFMGRTVSGVATGGNWLTLAANLRTPASSNSVLVSFVVLPGAATDFDVFYDVLFFGDVGMIFWDGFESGDTSVWSNQVP